MLVLTRNVNEWLCIGPDIRILIVGRDNGGVQLGIQAPSHIAIWRPGENDYIAERMGQLQHPDAPDDEGSSSCAVDDPAPREPLPKSMIDIVRSTLDRAKLQEGESQDGSKNSDGDPQSDR